MKYALLVSRTLADGSVNGCKNIGDYVQSLAAAQFMPRVDEYYDKTKDDVGTDPIKMIMNAWYIWDPEKFPVSSRIIPLPISMHISPVCSERLLSLEKVLTWFKKNEPIGCRDKATMDLLKSKGIDSYFSGCLTLTLGKKYLNHNKRNGVVFVDPYLPHCFREVTIWNYLNVFSFVLRHLYSYIKIQKKFNHSCCTGKAMFIKKLLYTALFLKIYSRVLNIRDLVKADFITHIVNVGEGTLLNTEVQKLDYAEQLIKKYSESELVLTSRIHCALPCLGIETPVLFTVGSSIEEKSPKESAGRFDGLIGFFNIVRIKGIKINEYNGIPKQNKNDYKCYADALKMKCEEFMSDNYKH